MGWHAPSDGSGEETGVTTKARSHNRYYVYIRLAIFCRYSAICCGILPRNNTIVGMTMFSWRYYKQQLSLCRARPLQSRELFGNGSTHCNTHHLICENVASTHLLHAHDRETWRRHDLDATYKAFFVRDPGSQRQTARRERTKFKLTESFFCVKQSDFNEPYIRKPGSHRDFRKFENTLHQCFLGYRTYLFAYSSFVT